MLVQMRYQVQVASHGRRPMTDIVPGLGDAAKFGTAHGGAGLIGSAWFIQLRGGDVAHLTVSCLDPSGAEAPIIALARDLLGQL